MPAFNGGVNYLDAMIDHSHIGRMLPSHSARVEKGRLRFFATAIGETDPVYFDEAAAQAAGYPALPAPPTFAFCLDMEQSRPLGWLEDMGVDLGRILHGEQSFTYHAMIHAGDVLNFSSRVADVYENKGGALDFVIKETRVTTGDAALVAELRSVIIVRND